jgi:hypothetical protein
MGVDAVKYFNQVYSTESTPNLPQVYMLGHWNCLHLLVRSVVSPNHAKHLSRVLQAVVDIKQSNLVLCRATASLCLIVSMSSSQLSHGMIATRQTLALTARSAYMRLTSGHCPVNKRT